MKIYKFVFPAVIFLAAFLRVYQLDKIPAGIYVDEASQGFNAYSLLLTSKDEYGKSFPIFFRSLGNYQAPLYTYISTIPIHLLGLNIFSLRILSALGGILMVCLSFFLLKKEYKIMDKKMLYPMLLLAIVPWSILFSRGAFEANLALTLVVAGSYFLVTSLEKPLMLILASGILALSSYAYPSERVFAPLLLMSFIFIYRRIFLKNTRYIFFSLALFIFILLPQLFLLTSSGANARIDNLNFFGEIMKGHYSHNGLINSMEKLYFLVREFFSQYSAYFSPKNLFFASDPDPLRSIPHLSVFYWWMIIPLFLGFKDVINKKKTPLISVLFLTIFLSPIAAGITKDPFSTLRTLPLFWALTILAGIGLNDLLALVKKTSARATLLLGLVIISLGSLYSSYFVLLRNEQADTWGYGYKEIASFAFTSDKAVLVDDPRWPSYILFAFYGKVNPLILQKQYNSVFLSDYYNQTKYSPTPRIENIVIRPIYWREDECIDQYIVGRVLSVSQKQAREHKLTEVKTIKSLDGEDIFKIYKTNPNVGCKPAPI